MKIYAEAHLTPTRMADSRPGPDTGYRILNLSEFPLELLLTNAPPESVLAQHGHLNVAGRMATRIVSGANPIQRRDGKGPVTELLMVGADGTILGYQPESNGRKYGYRRWLCDNWRKCRNPSGPWRFYALAK